MALADGSVRSTIAAWLEGAGDPNGEVFAKFEAAAARLLDPKHGVEVAPVVSRARPEPPTDIEAVPASMYAAFASVPFKEARATVEGWLKRAARTRFEQAFVTAVRSQPGIRTPIVLRALERIERTEKRRSRRKRTKAQTLRLPGMDLTETMDATGAVK